MLIAAWLQLYGPATANCGGRLRSHYTPVLQSGVPPHSLQSFKEQRSLLCQGLHERGGHVWETLLGSDDLNQGGDLAN